MPLRAGHGRGSGRPHPEVMISRRVLEGIPGEASQPPPKPARRADGSLLRSPEQQAMARLGGLARAQKRQDLRVLQRLGLHGTPKPELELYWQDANAFSQHEVKRIAQVVGGGHCGASPCSMIQSAALQLAASRKLFADGNFFGGSKLADASRQNLLAAHEIAAKEAIARRKAAQDAPQVSPLLSLVESPLAPQAPSPQVAPSGVPVVQATQAPVCTQDSEEQAREGDPE